MDTIVKQIHAIFPEKLYLYSRLIKRIHYYASKKNEHEVQNTHME